MQTVTGLCLKLSGVAGMKSLKNGSYTYSSQSVTSFLKNMYFYSQITSTTGLMKSFVLMLRHLDHENHTQWEKSEALTAFANVALISNLKDTLFIQREKCYF